VVTHLSKVKADSLVAALNRLMLGARILQSGGVQHEEEKSSGLLGFLHSLKDADSKASRALLLVQGAAFSTSFIPGPQSPVLALVAVLLAHGLLRRACQAIVARRISMHVLMLIVLLGALYLEQFTEAATVAFLVNISEWIVGRSQQAVENELEKSMVGAASHATLLFKKGGSRTGGVSVKIEELSPGDVVLLKSGSVVPTDGRLLRAEEFMVNESAVTGEALPAEKSVGSQLLSGTVVATGVAEMECTTTAADSFQGRMKAAVQDARSSRSDMEELVNRFAEIYTPVVLGLSLVIAILSESLTRGLTVLVSACPCAVVAAAPVVQSCCFVRLLSDLQVLVKDARALEGFARVTSLGTDKTGTLTKGTFELAEVVVLDGEKTNLLRLLAALESQDSHPLASALVRSFVGCAADFDTNGPDLPKVSNFTRVESMGVWGIVQGQVVGAGSRRFLDSMAISLPDTAEAKLASWEAEGGVYCTVFMTLEEEVVMMLRLEDEVREDAAAAIGALQQLGVEITMLTGDEHKAANVVGEQLGIQKRLAKLTPTAKEDWVKSGEEPGPRPVDLEGGSGLSEALVVKRSRQVVAMIGDGLNDGPALAAADVGVAIAAGLQLTTDAADVVIGSGGRMLLRFVQALYFARSCKELIRANLALALVVKLSALILAATGHLGLTLGVLSDSGSLLLVLLNSLRPLMWGFTAFDK